MPVLHRFVVCIAMISVTALAAPAAAAPPTTATLRHQAEAWSSGPLAAFLQAKATAPAPFDWSDDGCSVVPDRPMGFDFHATCQRHDFGYRNFGRGGLALDPSPGRRARLDRRFKADLDAVCARPRLGAQRSLCSALALTYYEGVRLLGASAFGR